MVILRNIKRHDGILSADYFPEGDELMGSVSISEKDGEEVGRSMPPNDGGSYCRHAIQGLQRLIGESELPEEWRIMWY